MTKYRKKPVIIIGQPYPPALWGGFIHRQTPKQLCHRLWLRWLCQLIGQLKNVGLAWVVLTFYASDDEVAGGDKVITFKGFDFSN